MPSRAALRIVPATSARALTREQKRFNTLLRQIEQARRTLQHWLDGTAQYQRSFMELIPPLQTTLRVTRRQWVFALQAIASRRNWTRAERALIDELVCEEASSLLQDDDDDAALRELFATHAGIDFDAERRGALDVLKAMTESMTGLDLGDTGDIVSEEELMQRLQQRVQQQAEAEEAANAERAAKRAAKAGTTEQARKPSAAQQRREAEAQQVTQSVREVYRKLASALHPDRETDLTERDAKTALMQQVNQAYEKNDLLALLELQLRIEQIDADHMSQATPQRVQHYNKVLAGQLEEIKLEAMHVEMAFCVAHGLGPDHRLKPQQLGLLLQQQAGELRADDAQLHNEMRLFNDPAATKRWLKARRRALNEVDSMDLF